MASRVAEWRRELAVRHVEAVPRGGAVSLRQKTTATAAPLFCSEGERKKKLWVDLFVIFQIFRG